MGTFARHITAFTVLVMTVPGVRFLCLENCRRSSQTEQHCESVQCTEGCVSGWYGSQCTRRCSHLCLGSLCNQDDGRCTIGCKRTGLQLHRYRLCPGYSKINKRSTNETCYMYKHNKTGDCICCHEYYRGKQCETYCENCRTIKTDYICEYICKSGYFGSTCNTTCPNECAVGNTGKPVCIATQKTYKCSSCSAGRYGAQCDKNCKPNCRDGLCRQDNGECVECIDNYFGQFCEKKCDPICSGGLCLRNGTCLKGCKEASNGSLCHTSCIAKCSPCNNTKSVEVCLLYCDEDCLLDICYGNGTCNNSHSEFESVCSNCRKVPLKVYKETDNTDGGSLVVPIVLIVVAVVVATGIAIGLKLYRRRQRSNRTYNTRSNRTIISKEDQSEAARSLHDDSDEEVSKVEKVKTFRRFQNYFRNLVSRPQTGPEIIIFGDMPELSRKINPTIVIFTESALEKEAIDIMLDGKKHYSIEGDRGAFTAGEIGSQRVVSMQLSRRGEFPTEVNKFVTRCLGYFKNVKHVFVAGVCIATESRGDQMRCGDVIASVADNDSPYIYCQASEGFPERKWAPKDDTLQNIAKELASEDKTNPPWKKHVEKGQSLSMKFIRPSEEYGKTDVIDRMYADDEMPRLHCGIFGPKPVISEEENASSQHVTAFDTGIQNPLDSITGNGIDSFVIIRGITAFQNEEADSRWEGFACVAAAALVRTIIEKLESEQEIVLV